MALDYSCANSSNTCVAQRAGSYKQHRCCMDDLASFNPPLKEKDFILGQVKLDPSLAFFSFCRGTCTSIFILSSTIELVCSSKRITSLKKGLDT